VDPISILFAANACVAAIREGCELYKQAKSSFMEVKSTVEEAVGMYRKLLDFGVTLVISLNPRKNQSRQSLWRKRRISM